ncbi:hypothetical protein MMC26_001946 [Xylographa opegraphella]|nr:hypothetical protein [Xylographa opegraphella]
MATTPPMLSAVRTPPTPLHGAKYDSYQTYNTRKSTRFMTQRAARTPSPDSLPVPQKRNARTSQKSSAVRSVAHTYSPPSSTQTSPQKRIRRSTKEQSDLGNDVVGPTEDVNPHHAPNNLTVDPTMMLPTPAKTPRKRNTQPVLTGAARVLFPNRPDNIDEAMPTPTKHGRRPKKHIGFSLDSFDDGDGSSEGKIEIYTDSKDRLPEVDESEDNPFYVKPCTEPMTTKRAGKRRKVNDEPNHNEEVQEMLKRDEGMVYVFRGKKIYRKFEVDPDAHESDEMAVSPAQGSTGHRPLTRSSIKPRLLFPNTPQPETEHPDTGVTDEEAVTDIEDPHAHDSDMTELAPETGEEALVTPVKPSFTPTSPPSTGRATRASTKKAALDSSPMGPETVEVKSRFVVKHGRTASPFDNWRRTKAGAVSGSKGKKREGESLEKEPEGSKKVKSNGH